MKTKIGAGILAGLIAGFFFGIALQMMQTTTAEGPTSMMVQIGTIVGRPDPVVGWIYHMLNSALMGAIFGALLGAKVIDSKTAVVYGLVYGVSWFVLGWLILLPIFLGFPAFAPLTMPVRFAMLASLIGHLLFGVITALGFRRLYKSATIVPASEIREPAGVR